MTARALGLIRTCALCGRDELSDVQAEPILSLSGTLGGKPVLQFLAHRTCIVTQFDPKIRTVHEAFWAHDRAAAADSDDGLPSAY